MINLKNLQIAVDGIKKLNIPENKFSMEYYGFLENMTKETFSDSSDVEVSDCGTSACFLGWFPLVKGLEISASDFEYFGALDFDKYSKRILNINSEFSTNIWHFLFASEWNLFAPTLENALERAQIVLDGMHDPNWDYHQYSNTARS